MCIRDSFEIADARGNMGDYDLGGVLREQNTRTDLSHLRFQGWSVPLREVDALLHSGSLHPGMLELLLKLLRPCLPPTTRLRHTHDLQRNRIQDSAKTKGPAPTLHAFPYQSISKKWALFVVEVHAGGHTLRRLLPKDHDERAFAFAVSYTHLTLPTKRIV